ncbi:SOS response-associated peptidase [Roseobacter sp. HKCCA0434]|uniref:SOS response-associated peptidase n=1 Tax=Roseobacter sp. HKCCA0434 TaxID=3079297 RepID=UPI002905AE57|nr:SOS response-associated peptidase [Roseobacter sp. HKCCA0434]
MPGRVFLHTDGAALARFYDVAGSDVPTGDDLAPQDMLGLVVPGRLVRARWGLIPKGAVNARGRPVLEQLVNIRSETLHEKRAFEDVRHNRCILPCSGWYEWTGETRRKTRWAIHAPDRPILSFAAIYDIWQAPGGIEVVNFATLTCAPNADVRDYHHRMPVILDDPSAWLAGADVEMVPVVAGLLQVERSTLP